MRTTTAWFRVADDAPRHAGEVILSGWKLSALPTLEGWFAYAICPRCFALVVTDEHRGYGDQSRGHERWHAATDFPIPEELR